jgi:hypothetical protein
VRSFDKASDRALILAAYRSNRLAGDKAWDQFTQRSLWHEKEEEFFHYHNGLETVETQKELWRAPDEFKSQANDLIRSARQSKIIGTASEDWLRDLFGLPRKADG